MRVLHVGLARRVSTEGAAVPLIDGVTRLYFDGDMDASVANTGQVSSRIVEVLPVAEVIRSTWVGAQSALSAATTRF
jgi:enoyl-[acyl-carrier protein] reductase II